METATLVALVLIFAGVCRANQYLHLIAKNQVAIFKRENGAKQ